MNPVLVKIIFQATIKRAAHTSLVGRNRDRRDVKQGRFTHDDVNHILKEVWSKYDQLAHRVPQEPKLGNQMNMFLRFPFTPPGYRFERVSNPNGISFDMLRCRIAEFFQSQTAADLCIDTWCNLDFPLAEMWSGRLERIETLAAGDSRCNFRFNAIK